MGPGGSQNLPGTKEQLKELEQQTLKLRDPSPTKGFFIVPVMSLPHTSFALTAAAEPTP